MKMSKGASKAPIKKAVMSPAMATKVGKKAAPAVKGAIKKRK